DQSCVVRPRRCDYHRHGPWKFFCTSATLASGIPLGREGPAVQVGGGIASVLGRHLGLRPEKVKELLPVGAAAAIAAAFNTPLAAVLFALEAVMGDLHAPVLGSVVLGSATSWVVLRLLLGNNPLFNVPSWSDLPAIICRVMR
ncbi:MAG: chloride channel protein, partial [Candidatus Sulfotelmatobacter sp.]